ncbi:hypothetical protein HYT26_02580 [Candidatus Pacearchaeota archaeon]|nr:hypothetical protein [Candidatus Pacearchaeota archaeon]
METATVVIIVILILALLFFGFTMINSNNAGTARVASSSYPSGQIAGGGCGR